MSTQPKFTPGPWRASEFWSPPVGNFEYPPEERDANGNVFYGYSILGRNEHGGEILPTLAAVHNFPRNIKANADLIAAAPELYREGRASARTMDDVADVIGAHGLLDLADELRIRARQMRAALLKVTGQA